ncbi:MAG: hypothetical protein O7G83_12850 [Proteobacteria bacterium]|nr:hypothetical protein [Pseudomonadota bacterium]
MSDDQFYIDAGRRLRELRERGLNETPAQFAKRFGLTVRDYLAYEEGRRSRGWTRHIDAIADTGVSLDWLFDTHASRAMFRPTTA